MTIRVANMCAAAAKPTAGQRNAVEDEQECRHAAWLMRWMRGSISRFER